MKYIFISFTGASFSIAKRLMDEGNEVMVGQVRWPEFLKTKGWQSAKESPELRRRRLSLYDGLLKKWDADDLVREMRKISDAGKAGDYFVVLEHNNLAAYGERILKLGFTGMLPNMEDYEREKNRVEAQEFVKTYYKDVHLLPSQEFKSAADGIAFVEGSGDPWVLKSNGNFGNTVVPRTANVELNHRQIVGALQANSGDYEKGGYLLEEQIPEPIEFAPVLAFWEGKPVYAHIEFECKPMCCGDVGPDAGGAINLIRALDCDHPCLEQFFPPIVHEIAKARRGLFLFDAGILYDSKKKKCFFTEFAGNRWGWGGVFSELTLANRAGKSPTRFFEGVAAGKNPFRYRYGSTVSFYNDRADTRYPRLVMEDLPIYTAHDIEPDLLYLQQIKLDKEGVTRNVGFKDDEDILGYACGYGDTLARCIDRAYSTIEKVSFEGMVYRHKEDFLSTGYHSALMRRLEIFTERFL